MTKTPTIADRVEALEALLTQKGIVTSEQLDSIVARYADQVGPLNGARLIARAWTDPEFKARLLDDATSVVHEWKLEGGQVDRLVVKENTKNIHNVVVCTLCSCYPWAILGLPPKWYKSPEYRSRIVVEPRTVLSQSDSAGARRAGGSCSTPLGQWRGTVRCTVGAKSVHYRHRACSPGGLTLAGFTGASD